MKPSTDTLRWERLRALFEQALDLDDAARLRLQSESDTADPELGEELRRLLAAHARHADRTGEQRERLLTDALAVIDATTIAVGGRVGPYELREELGRGGMGLVFRGERVDGQVSQAVAIKLVAASAFDQAAQRRFLLEREILAGLEHPNIARLLDAGRTGDGSPYFVMELVRGAPIVRYADEHVLGIEQRLHLFLEVCGALEYAHGKLVLHRDIKPSNVLVDAGGMPKLIDFGIAKGLSRDDQGTEATGTQQRFLSPSNAAPEQWRGERATVACDVYQLGTLLYELLCGAPVFDLAGLNAAQIEQRILDAVPESPSARARQGGIGRASARGVATPTALAAKLRGDLDSIVSQALRKSPPERYASVQLLADDLEYFLENRPIKARRDHRWYRLGRFLRRNRWSVAAATAGLVLITAFVATTLFQNAQVTRERDVARLERDRSEAITAFLLDVFKAADPAESLARDTPISAVLDNGRRRVQTDLGDKPELQARVLGVMGQVYFSLSETKLALDMLDQANTTLTRSSPDDVRARIEIGTTRANVLSSLGNDAAARIQAQQVIDLHRQLGDSPGAATQARFVLAKASSQRNEASARIAELHRILADVENDPAADPIDVAKVELELADQMVGIYQSDDALRLTNTAIKRLESALPKNHPQMLEAKMQLADVLDYGLSRSDEALVVVNEVLGEQQRLFGEQSLSVANTWMVVGNTQMSLERYPEAIASLEHARSIYRQLRGDKHQDLMRVAVNVAAVREAMGELDAAAEQYGEALRMAEATIGADGADTIMVRAMLGGVRIKQKRYHEAIAILSRCVQDTGYEAIEYAQIIAGYAQAFIGAGRTAEALEVLDKVQPLLDREGDKSPDAVAKVARLRKEIAQIGPKGR